jgi:hypothetical protein
MALVMLACQHKEGPVKAELPQNGPIQLHPENPHYFLYEGKTLALITSAEHYGALVNLDFDYKKYLETLEAEGMNYTRIFTGTYFEINGESFNIENNTLAPKKDRVITPWALVISDLSGGTKYDLSAWNSAYFDRMRDFMTIADDHNIIVEITLFSSIYRDMHWDINPQNPVNNVNIKHEVTRFDAQTLNNGTLITHQENFVKKMVTELNEFDNFFFEIQNEPWSDHNIPVYNIVNKGELKDKDWQNKADFADEAAMAWQAKIASFIEEEEKDLPKRHLIAQNYTNYKAPIPSVDSNISIVNFHYAWPDAVEWNYHFDKVIGFDESGFAGSDDTVYRQQAWQFMLSGGGLFNSLDYSFFVGNEDGRGVNKAPGGGSKALRQQLKTLSDFLHSFKLEKLKPNQESVKSALGLIPYVLSIENNSYAVYLRSVGTNSTTLSLTTGNGSFEVQSINTLTGAKSELKTVVAKDGVLELDINIPDGELALKLTRK